MDLRERHQLDVAAAAHKVNAKVQPWRSIFALLIAVAGAIAADGWGVKGWGGLHWHNHHTQKLIFVSGLAAFVIFGLIAAVGLSGNARSALQPVVGQAHAGVVRYVLVLAGVFAVLAITLGLSGIRPTQLLVGGAIGGVLLGIAAQQSLSNLFAGLVLLFARPFRVGDHVRFRAGALSGMIEGYVTDISLTYVRLETDEGRVLVPNSQALAAAVLLISEPPNGATAGTPTDSAGATATLGIVPAPAGGDPASGSAADGLAARTPDGPAQP